VTHWHDSMVDRPETDGATYLTGWTISGIAVLATIVAVWGPRHLAAVETSANCWEEAEETGGREKPTRWERHSAAFAGRVERTEDCGGNR
jgi:hypothetical protein